MLKSTFAICVAVITVKNSVSARILPCGIAKQPNKKQFQSVSTWVKAIAWKRQCIWRGLTPA